MASSPAPFKYACVDGAVELFRDAVEDVVQFGFRCESVDARMALLERFAQDLKIPAELCRR